MTKNEVNKEWLKVFRTLSEPQKRWFAAVKSSELGYGGISKVSQTTGLSRTTITLGLKEVKDKKKLTNSGRIRREGGCRKLSSNFDGKLVKSLEEILSETTAGDPMSAIR